MTKVNRDRGKKYHGHSCNCKSCCDIRGKGIDAVNHFLDTPKKAYKSEDTMEDIENFIDEMYSLAWQDGREVLNRREDWNTKFQQVIRKLITLSKQEGIRLGREQGIRETTQKVFDWIDEQHKNDKPWDGGCYVQLVDEFRLKELLDTINQSLENISKLDNT